MRDVVNSRAGPKVHMLDSLYCFFLLDGQMDL